MRTGVYPGGFAPNDLGGIVLLLSFKYNPGSIIMNVAKRMEKRLLYLELIMS